MDLAQRSDARVREGTRLVIPMFPRQVVRDS